MTIHVPVVAVMGLTGSGKSYFIAQLTGDDSITGDNLESETQGVHAYNVVVDGTEMVIIDTPGMNDTNRSDAIVLKEIADWVQESYEREIRLSAVIYMHDISQERMAGSSVASLNIFKELCGEDFYKNIVFVSNRWDKTTEKHGNKKLKQLKDKYWGSMLELGALAIEFKDDMTAHRIMSMVRDNDPEHTKLGIQLVRDKKSLVDCDAGKIADMGLNELTNKHKQELADINKQLEALKDNDTKMQKLLKEEQANNEKRIRQLEQEAIALREATKKKGKSFWGKFRDTALGMGVGTLVAGPVGGLIGGATALARK